MFALSREAWGVFLLEWEMVFFIRETLTAEDRAAWTQFAARRKRDEARCRRCDQILYGIIWVLWLALKFFGLFSIICGAAFLPDCVGADVPLWLRFIGVSAAVVLIGCGIRLLFLFRHSPGWPPPMAELSVPAVELSDVQVQAAFFEDGCFTFWNASEKVRLGYSSITGAWEDGDRFYLFLAGRPPLVLPKRGLARWMPEDFRDFLERELGAPVERIN